MDNAAQKRLEDLRDTLQGEIGKVKGSQAGDASQAVADRLKSAVEQHLTRPLTADDAFNQSHSSDSSGTSTHSSSPRKVMADFAADRVAIRPVAQLKSNEE